MDEQKKKEAQLYEEKKLLMQLINELDEEQTEKLLLFIRGIKK